MAKRGSPRAHILGDVEALKLAGGTVMPSYHSKIWVARIAHAIATPIRCAEGEAIESFNFFALASDSSMDHVANQQELVYTRTVRKGEVHTPLLGPCDFQDGTTAGILAAYKQTMLHTGLLV